MPIMDLTPSQGMKEMGGSEEVLGEPESPITPSMEIQDRGACKKKNPKKISRWQNIKPTKISRWQNIKPAHKEKLQSNAWQILHMPGEVMNQNDKQPIHVLHDAVLHLEDKASVGPKQTTHPVTVVQETSLSEGAFTENFC